ncbi:MAG TPA: GntR family transcriptional regulator [Bacillus bacterium]|uniref:GntR family transcriptional regulator n=1 Tax=Siminovitchia fordii TaxID=254759 RepID=A0ABQ4K5D0_9BACI|nr:GntR family transcriptional regulator [Siminovitchia fordii]GIN20932.1 GntR family transcriptional regulator [Siminovitchia fordii]HBZ12098.1 GntR family transcriptional regulator [Bacillus sp. (in: firmicutes)]
MKINKELAIPLYQQVKDYLHKKIISGEWAAGYQLPAEKDLATQFGVSTITIKRAVLELVDEGLLYRQSGKGTFVMHIEEKDISKFVTLKNEEWEAQHHPHKTLYFNIVQADDELAALLRIEEGDLMYQIQRLKIQQDQPVALEYSYIPQELFPDLHQEDIDDNLLYNIFQRGYGVQLDKAKIYFSTVLADEYQAESLNVERGVQLFVFERFTFNNDNHIIEYSKFIIKQDQSKYFLEIKL